MAAETGMIEPFEPDQVRTGKNNDRLISYGTSPVCVFKFSNLWAGQF